MNKIETVDDVISELTDLRHLLEAAYNILHEMDYGTGLTRNHELDRVAALTRIARDMCERIGNETSDSHATISGATSLRARPRLPVDNEESGES